MTTYKRKTAREEWALTPSPRSKAMTETYKIEVVDAFNGDVVKTLETANLRTAERVERGLNINLNHEKFYTRIVEPKP